MPYDVETYEEGPSGLQPNSPNQRLPLSRRIWAHISLGWITLLLATGFYTTTVIYSWHPAIFSRFEIIGRSPARALGFLAILVQLGGIFLTGAICHAVGLLANIRLSCENGTPFLEYLVLQAGTAFEGWVEVMWRAPLREWRPRVWSVLRFLSITIVPIIAIVIMSDVNTAISFTAIPVLVPARGYGVGEFNSSLAIILQPLTDALFATRFKDFTSDSDLSIDITEDADRVACENPKNSQGGCRTSYFIPGGVQNGAPALLNQKGFTSASSFQPILALNQKGYVFDFEDGLDSNSINQYLEGDCLKFGFNIGAVELCLRNRELHELQVYLTLCPKDLAANVKCMDNSTWPSSGGWGTTLSLSTLHANIGYNGQNGTILYHEFLDQKQNVSINATEVLSVFNTLFIQPVNTSSEWGGLLTALGISSNRPVVSLTIWQYFEGLAELATTNALIAQQAFAGLHSLIAIPIYHCQPKDFADLRKVLLRNLNNGTAIGSLLGPKIVNAFPDATEDTDIVPAKIRWNLNVGRATLIAYIIINGGTLLACFIARLVESCSQMGRNVQHMGAFPLLDEKCDSVITSGGIPVQPETFRGFQQGARLVETANFSVVLARKRPLQTLEMMPTAPGNISPPSTPSTIKEPFESSEPSSQTIPRSLTAPARIDVE